MDFGEIVGAVVLGLVAGFIARALLPGKQHMGLLLTMLLGIGGAVVGYLIFAELLGIGDDDKFDLGGLPGAIIGAMILLFIYERFASRNAGAATGAAVGGELSRAERKRQKQERKRQKQQGQPPGAPPAA